MPRTGSDAASELLHSRTHTRTHIHGLAKPTGPWCQEDTGSAATLNALTAGKPRDYLVVTLDRLKPHMETIDGFWPSPMDATAVTSPPSWLIVRGLPGNAPLP